METETREGKTIQLPTDDDDCSAWIMDKDRNVRFISAAELDAFPEYVTETINFGCLAVEPTDDGLVMVSPTLEQLFEETQS